MSQQDGKRSDTARPLSIPPELDDLDTSWDDDPAALAPPLPPAHMGEHDQLDRPTPIVEESVLATNYSSTLGVRAPTEPAGPLAAGPSPLGGNRPRSADPHALPELPRTPPPTEHHAPAARSISEDALPLTGVVVGGGQHSVASSARTLIGPAPDLSPRAGPSTLLGPSSPAAPPPPALREPELPDPPPSSGLLLDLDDALDSDSALELADRHTPIAPLEPEPPSAPSRAPALERVGAPAPSSAPDSPATNMRERYATGDYSGALVIAEGILEDDPDDAVAQRFAQNCRDVLIQMYTAHLGSLDVAPRVIVPPDQIRWLSLDHRAGFLLAQVDGSARVEDILDMSGMPRLEALRILVTLLDQGVIAVE